MTESDALAKSRVAAVFEDFASRFYSCSEGIARDESEDESEEDLWIRRILEEVKDGRA